MRYKINKMILTVVFNLHKFKIISTETELKIIKLAGM
jgi:hypothetical protein